MPTYDYKCPKCGTLFELFQKMTAKPGAKCPKCGAKAERQMSAGAGLVFKGSGFYLTDYGRSGQPPRKTDSDASSASSTADKKSDAPAAKPAAKSRKKDE